MFNKFQSFFKPTMAQVKKLDNMLDEFPILRAYLYYTAFYTFAGTVGGAASGALLGAHDFIMQVDYTNQKSDALIQYRTGDIKEPIFQRPHTWIQGRAATDRETYVLNLMFCSLLTSYEGARLGFKTGISSIRCPVQHIVSPILVKMYEHIREQKILKEEQNQLAINNEDTSPSLPRRRF